MIKAGAFLLLVLVSLILPKTNVRPQTIIYLGGDVMLGRTVMTTSLDQSNPNYSVTKIKDQFADADIVLVNLENPFVTGCRRDNKSMTFCAVPQMVEALTSANIKIVNLANNHSKNYGEPGLNETVAVLNSRSIKSVGVGELVIKNVNNTNFGFLGFDFFSKQPTQADYDLVNSSNSKVDVLIVTIHWGIEYEANAAQYQTDWANKLIENGADVIAGHHPHVVQNIDYLNGKPVYYSLGNLIFDQMWSQKTREGLIIKLTFEGSQIAKEEHLKTFMHNWAQPEFIKE